VSNPVERFRIAARSYCEVVDATDVGQELEEVVKRLHEAVTEVYAAALHLSLPSVDDNEPDVEEVTHEERMRLYERLRAVLGPVDEYFEIWDSDETEPRTVVEGSLADSLAGVYCDLRDGLALDTDGAEVDAVFAWQLGFWTHWGRHAADVVRVLQLLREREGWRF
jgi:hypothetical protein